MALQFLTAGNVGVGSNAPNYNLGINNGQVLAANNQPTTYGPGDLQIIPGTQGPVQNLQYGSQPFGPGLPNPQPQPTPQPQPQAPAETTRPGGMYEGWPEWQWRADMAHREAMAAEARRQQEESQRRMNAEIESLYNPVLSSLSEQERVLKETGLEQTKLLEQRKKSTGEQLDREKLGAETTLTEQRRLTEQSGLSAQEQARRAFQALQQQSRARFGGAGSAGLAATEIGQREYFRQQGGVSQALTNALAQFGLEGTRLATFITGKKEELENWFNEANQQIQSGVRQGLLAITNQKGAIESAKAEARLNLLREAQQLARDVANQDRELKSTLAANAINIGQQLAQRVFTPQETAAIWNGIFSSQLTGIGQAASPIAPQLVGGLGQRRDELGNVIT